jgi:peptidoglycan/xylan/chitin deacetylase (PgdA/CDA1 family)
MLDNGWDIYSHTWDHPRLTERYSFYNRTSIEKNLKWMMQNRFYDFKWFAYPYGRTSEEVIREIDTVHKYARICRATNPNVKRVYEKFPFEDPYRVMAHGFSSEYNLQHAYDLVDHNDGLLIFYIHEVGKTDSRMGCKLNDLQKLVARIGKQNIIPLSDIK